MRSGLIIRMAQFISMLFIAIAIMIFVHLFQTEQTVIEFFAMLSFLIKFLVVMLWVAVGIFSCRFTNSEFALLVNLAVLIAMLVVLFKPSHYFHQDMAIMFYLFLIFVMIVSFYNIALVEKRWQYITSNKMIGWIK